MTDNFLRNSHNPLKNYVLLGDTYWAPKLKDSVPDDILLELPTICEKFKITTRLRLAHFLSQCSHESGGFKHVEENLNYSLKALRLVFRKYFPTDELAGRYARNPQKIANRVYGNRMGNGPESSGDGWKYRGRGYIQLTGKNNYTSFSQTVKDDVVLNPGVVSTKYPLTSAGWFWDENNLNDLADNGSDDKAIRQVTLRINGGTNGLDCRKRKFKKFFEILA